MDHGSFSIAFVAGVAFAAFAMGLIVALGIVLSVANHVSSGAVAAFATGLIVPALLGLFAIHHRRKSARN